MTEDTLITVSAMIVGYLAAYLAPAIAERIRHGKRPR